MFASASRIAVVSGGGAVGGAGPADGAAVVGGVPGGVVEAAESIGGAEKNGQVRVEAIARCVQTQGSLSYWTGHSVSP